MTDTGMVKRRGRARATWARVAVLALVAAISVSMTGLAQAAPVRNVPAAMTGPSAGTVTPRVNSSYIKNSAINAVSCISSTSCVAVGYYEAGSPAPQQSTKDQTLVETWDGAAWSITPSPNPGTDDQFTGVSCISATSCVAVGTDDQVNALVEFWDGTAWSVVAGINVPPAEYFLQGVSCTPSANASPIACIAVGDYYNGSDDETAIVSTDGTTWSFTPGPDAGSPGSDTANILKSVSCTSSTSCVATGWSSPGNTFTQTLIASWDGTSWSITPSPSPSSSYNYLTSVSCTSPASCVTVGYDGSSGPYLTLAETWDGTAWTLSPSLNPGSEIDVFSGVSCTSPAHCLAVGNYYNGTIFETLAEFWNGTAWSLSPSLSPSTIVPSPVGTDANNFYGASCTSPTTCVAVGNYYGGASFESLAENWNGAAWSLAPTPGVTITTSSLPAGTKGQQYSASLSAAGGTPPYTWEVASGKLPKGLTLDKTTGVISGTPGSKSATSSFTIEVLDTKTGKPKTQNAAEVMFTIPIS